MLVILEDRSNIVNIAGMSKPIVDQKSPQSVEIVVIGGGVIGCAAAYYLAKQGRSVALFEKGRIAGEQSSRNWGSVRAQRRPPAELPLMIDCIRLWENLEEELEAKLDWRQQGQIRLCYDETSLNWAEDWVPTGRENGLDTQVLSSNKTHQLLPGFNAKDLLGTLYSSTDRCAEPEKVAPAFASAASRLGAYIQDYLQY
ncbi:MAG: glycine/D-amino acid oxidase-like deaminating enzyme [Gammaproteobacteria bacterium]